MAKPRRKFADGGESTVEISFVETAMHADARHESKVSVGSSLVMVDKKKV